MEEFPFSAEEWNGLTEAARSVTNATLQDDVILRDSAVVALRFKLDELKNEYGKHPVLLETKADFANDYAESEQLYREALVLALDNRLPTISIRLSLATLLLESLNDFMAGREQLALCCDDVHTIGEGFEQMEWRRLQQLCQRQLGSDVE